MIRTPCAQSSARFFFRQFISTVAFCHRHHIAHRDLKLDNALLDTEHPPRILLTDFGFAARWGAGETPNMRGHLGCRPHPACRTFVAAHRSSRCTTLAH